MKNSFDESYVLFSPVGTTDPIRGYKDGPLLHIARVYRPCKIYIYLSNEMEKVHLKDNRYIKALESIGYEEERLIFISTDLKDHNPADFEVYYEEFPKIYDKIRKENKEQTILLNITSGTPQMNSFVYHSDIERVEHIQVLNPEKKAGTTDRTNTVDYDIDLEIACNEDNDSENFTNRCIVATKKNVTKFNTINALNKFLDNYEYNSCYELIKSSILFSRETKDLIKVGCYKQNLNLSEGYDFAKKKNSLEKFYPYKYDELFEYIINLQMKLDNKMFLDFARGITPIVDSLLEYYVKKVIKVDIGSFKDGKKINYNKVDKDIIDEYQRENRINLSEYVNRYFLISIIKVRGKNADEFIQNFEKLDKFYSNVRNMSAHQIVYINENIINEKCGYSPTYVMNLIKNLYLIINKKAKMEDFLILESLNKEIRKSFNRS